MQVSPAKKGSLSGGRRGRAIHSGLADLLSQGKGGNDFQKRPQANSIQLTFHDGTQRAGHQPFLIGHRCLDDKLPIIRKILIHDGMG